MISYYFIVLLFFSLLNNSSELKNYLQSVYARAAQYDSPPRYPVTVVCGGIDGASSGNDTLNKIFAGLVAYRGNRSCYVNQPRNLSETDIGWGWQVISYINLVILSPSHN